MAQSAVSKRRTLGFYARHLRSHPRHSSTSPQHKVVFSGIQPTGVPHLGNYLGALQQWTALQDEAQSSTELIFSIVDLHAITVQQNGERLRQWKRETLAALLAIGLDPERCTLFYQSAVRCSGSIVELLLLTERQVAEHTELMWILSCLAPVGQLSRMTQWKSKLSIPDHSTALGAGAATANLKLGLFSYPVLQAADILLYGATHIPVGEDQVQHLEFTRNCADAFNSIHGDILVKPDIILSRSRRVMSLREPNHKMSKSDPDHRSRIHINDSVSDIQMKIRLALTDSLQGVQYDPSLRPGVSNLLELLSHFDGNGLDVHELAQIHSTTTMRQFKDAVAAAIADGLSKMRDEYERLLYFSNACYLEDIAAEGAIKAKQKARNTISRVRCIQGLTE